MSQGWECPRCGEVYGPSVEKCTNQDCKKTPRATKAPNEFGEVLGDADDVDPGDLHDALYRPTVNQIPNTPHKKRRGGGGGGEGGGDQSDGSAGIY